MDPLVLVVLAALDARLLVCADVAIPSRGGFLAVDVRLAALEASDFLVRQGLVLDALLDALLLIDVALRVGRFCCDSAASTGKARRRQSIRKQASRTCLLRTRLDL